MKRRKTMPVSVVLGLVLCAGNALGQANSTAETANENSAPGASDAEQPGPEPQYVPALNGAGLFSLQSIQNFHVLAGGTVAGGFDTNPDNQAAGKSSMFFSYLPFIGVLAGNPRRQFLLQYRPILTQYTAYEKNVMQQASLSFASRPTPRFSWSFGLDGIRGDDSVRLLAPSHSVAVGGVAGAGPGNGAYLPNAGLVTNINGAVDLTYDASQRDVFGIQISDSFSSYSQLHTRSSVASEAVNYIHSLHPTVDILAYQQTSGYYGDLNCIAVGGGMGFRWEPRPDAKLSFEGGPQLNTPGCKNQQGFSYRAFFSANVTGRAQLYIQGNRQPVIAFLGPGLWQNDFSAGYQRSITARNAVSADLGYVLSSTLAAAQSYNGFFANMSYTRQITRPLSLSLRYQNFSAAEGTAHLSRNLLLVSITFTPESSSLSE